MKHLLQVLYLYTAPVLDTIDHMDDTFIQRIGQIYSDSLALNLISILLVQSAFVNTCMYCRRVHYEKSPLERAKR